MAGPRGADAPRLCGGRTSPGRPPAPTKKHPGSRQPEQGRAGRGGAGRSASGAAGRRGPRHHCRARRERARARSVPGVLAVRAAAPSAAGAAAAALCIVGAGGGYAQRDCSHGLAAPSFGSPRARAGALAGRTLALGARRSADVPTPSDPGPRRIAQPPPGAAIAGVPEGVQVNGWECPGCFSCPNKHF